MTFCIIDSVIKTCTFCGRHSPVAEKIFSRRHRYLLLLWVHLNCLHHGPMSNLATRINQSGAFPRNLEYTTKLVLKRLHLKGLFWWPSVKFSFLCSHTPWISYANCLSMITPPIFISQFSLLPITSPISQDSLNSLFVACPFCVDNTHAHVPSPWSIIYKCLICFVPRRY